MYVKLLAGYTLAFVLLVGYLFYLQRRVERLEDRVTEFKR